MNTMTRVENATTDTTVAQAADNFDLADTLVQTGSVVETSQVPAAVVAADADERMTNAVSTETSTETSADEAAPIGRVAKLVAFADSFTAGKQAKKETVSVRGSVSTALGRTVAGGVLFALFAFAQGQMMLLMNPDNPVMGDSSPVVSAEDQREVVEQARVAELSAKFDCKVEGFGEGVVPARALVRFPDKFEGRTKVVTFERAWGIVEGSEAGTVVAFCRR